MRSFFLKLLSQFGRNRTEHYQLHGALSGSFLIASSKQTSPSSTYLSHFPSCNQKEAILRNTQSCSYLTNIVGLVALHSIVICTHN